MTIKRWIPVVLVAGAALAGCGPTLAGSAAVVGDARLTDAELAQTTSELTQALGIPESPQVSQAVVSRWMVDQLVTQLADQKGIEVTKGDVDKVIATESENAGGIEALEQGALQAGVLPRQIPDAVRTSLLIEQMSKFTITGDDPTGQTGLLTQIQQLSESVDPQVSPRFGTWDAQQVSVGALPDDLSTPVPSDAGLGQLPQELPAQ